MTNNIWPNWRSLRVALLLSAPAWLALCLGCTSPTDPWPACERTTLPAYDETTGHSGQVQTTYCVVAVGAVP